MPVPENIQNQINALPELPRDGGYPRQALRIIKQNIQAIQNLVDQRDAFQELYSWDYGYGQGRLSEIGRFASGRVVSLNAEILQQEAEEAMLAQEQSEPIPPHFSPAA